MENERDLLEYEKKDVEKKLADQKTDSELLRGQLRVCRMCYILQQYCYWCVCGWEAPYSFMYA